jgi:membrane protease YdiL (CAAX protease family)
MLQQQQQQQRDIQQPQQQNSTHTTQAESPNITAHNTGSDTILISFQQRLLSLWRRYIPSHVHSVFRVLSSIVSILYNTINHSILLQLFFLLALYIFHMTVLSQHMAILCWNTIAIGYDSLIGAMIGIWYMIMQMIRPFTTSWQPTSQTIKSGSYTVSSEFPWNLPRPIMPYHDVETLDRDVNHSKLNNSSETSSSSITNDTKTVGFMIRHGITNWIKSQQTSSLRLNTIDLTWIRFRISMIVSCGALVKAYYQTGRYSLFWEDLLYSMSAAGWPLTIPLSRSIQVLAGHLTWVAAGCTILWSIPRPPPFFQSLQQQSQGTLGVRNGKTTNTSSINGSIPYATSSTTKYRWFQMSLRDCNWLWWTVGGYYVSSWLFNVADVLNRKVLPLQVLQDATESVVTQLVQPEQNDIVASLIGYIAPCMSAPIWEELLYRGFLLAGLTAWTGSYHVSCIVQAIIFSAHHMSITAALPLAVLGYTWAVLYTQSKNLWTVIAVHAMWNSRVFLGSWFGL